MGDGEQLGNVRFAAKTAEFFRDKIMLPFFVHYLKTPTDDFKLPKAYVFETGRNQWRKHDAWPPAEAAARMLYFSEGGKLSWTPPEGGQAFDEYVSDPAKPVPFTEETSAGMTYNYMTSDQRFAARRTDVLAYESEPLDRDVTVAGPIECDLRVSTTGTDADWVVKLIDVYPDEVADQPDLGGYQLPISEDIFRGRYRESFSKPEAITPNKPLTYRFALPNANHVFLPGHRIMVQVQSSWFPLYDRNPQTFVPSIFWAKPGDYQKATQRIYHAPGEASAIELPVLEANRP
jgi:putative CocE/NonD family hydrolase